MNHRHVIMGTAGHIDHGKTTLIRALTGKETDYIKEEKERGISIDIGFAPFQLDDGRTIGVIDVPGHEKFIKNMLAGIGGIDFVLLIIDVNEGVMPQTTEHYQIIELLGITKGIIVLTKVDLAEEEWVEFVKEDIREQFSGTIFANAPIVSVSATTGQGIDQLKKEIAVLADEVKVKEAVAVFRMPVDRVFSISGFGTVVTGTAISGTIRVGDRIQLLPVGKEGRIRGIQHHSQKVDAGFAGQRLAINISGWETVEIERGMVIVEPDVFQPTERLDVRIQMIANSPRELVSRARVRIYTGSSEVFGRVVLLEHEKLESGENGLAQIKLESPIVVEPKDRLVIRFYSPMETIGGGVVIEPHPLKFYKRFDEETLRELRVKEKGGIAERIVEALRKLGIASQKQLVTELKLSDSDSLIQPLQQLHDTGKIRFLQGQDLYMLQTEFQFLLKTTIAIIEDYYKKNRYTRYVSKGHVQSEVTKAVGKQVYKPRVLEGIWSQPEFGGEIETVGDSLVLTGYEVSLNEQEQKLVAAITDIYIKAAMTPPFAKEVQESLRISDGQLLQDLSMYLVEQQVLVFVAENMFFHVNVIEDIHRALQNLTSDKEKFTASEFRDHIDTSRKYAIALLEYFDRERITRRIGDERMLIKKVPN